MCIWQKFEKTRYIFEKDNLGLGHFIMYSKAEPEIQKGCPRFGNPISI